MKTYIGNLLQRIKSYSLTLDKLENFIDIPWVCVNENGVQEKYIFRRNGILLISRNSNVQTANWEYIPTAQSVLITADGHCRLYNQGFLSPAVLILKPDGLSEEHFALANAIELPDLDIEAHLRTLYYDKNKVKLLELYGGKRAEIHELTQEGVQVTCDGVPLPDGRYWRSDKKVSYDIKSGYIVEKYYFREISSRQGMLKVECKKSAGIFPGARVYLNNAPAPDGKYRVGWLGRLKVKDGKIVN